MKECYTKPITRIFLSKPVYEKMIFYGQKTPKVEVCGMLPGEIQNEISFPKDYIPVKNVADSGIMDYLMDPAEYGKVLLNTSIVRPKSDIDLAAVFHTHPFHEPAPSHVDIERAIWKTVYLILNPNKNSSFLKAWYWNGTEFNEIKLDVTI